MYGQTTMGVSCTILLAQRTSMAAAYSRGAALATWTSRWSWQTRRTAGALTLPSQRALIVSGAYADAVWCAWLPPIALANLISNTAKAAEKRSSTWAMVRGLVGAASASALRLGWAFSSSTTILIDQGHTLDLSTDSPAAVCLAKRDAALEVARAAFRSSLTIAGAAARWPWPVRATAAPFSGGVG